MIVPAVLRQLRRRSRRTAQRRDHVVRRHRFRQPVPRHAVGGRGIEAVAAEKGPGPVFGDDIAVEKQSASVGIFGAELDIVGHHHNGNARGGQPAENGGEYALVFRIQPFGGFI